MKKFFLLLSILPFFIFCGVASAQEYTLLEPGVYNDQFAVINSETSFSDYLNLIFKIGIGIAAGLAVIQIVIGGIQYMASESPFKIGDAKSKIEGAILGLILALGIYIFLYTINPDLVSLNLNIAKTAPSMTGTTPSVSSGAGTRSTTGVIGGDPTVTQAIKDRIAAILKDEQRVRDRLKTLNVGINASPCTVYGQKSCTNVGLLPDSTIAFLGTLKKACGSDCVVVVSGGTEFWRHATHAENRPIVDIGKNSSGPKITEYIIKTGLASGTRTNPNNCSSIGQTCIFGGARFYNENSEHWHVTTP
ncbi:MAG: pilin [Candidatus Paceibacterota bacterium]|jgi:hypothetical protein